MKEKEPMMSGTDDQETSKLQRSCERGGDVYAVESIQCIPRKDQEKERIFQHTLNMQTRAQCVCAVLGKDRQRKTLSPLFLPSIYYLPIAHLMFIINQDTCTSAKTAFKIVHSIASSSQTLTLDSISTSWPFCWPMLRCILAVNS